MLTTQMRFPHKTTRDDAQSRKCRVRNPHIPRRIRKRLFGRLLPHFILERTWQMNICHRALASQLIQRVLRQPSSFQEPRAIVHGVLEDGAADYDRDGKRYVADEGEGGSRCGDVFLQDLRLDCDEGRFEEETGADACDDEESYQGADSSVCVERDKEPEAETQEDGANPHDGAELSGAVDNKAADDASDAARNNEGEQ